MSSARQTLRRVIIQGTSRWPARRLICWRVETRLPRLAVTFDDGPHPTFTPMVLDILASHTARATFFVLGQEVEKHPGLLKRAIAEGHEIGVHGYDHTHHDLPRQMSRTLGIVRDLGGSPRAIRPPGGRLSPQIIAWSLRNRMSVSLWSFDVQDSRRYEGKASCRRPFEELSPGDIVLAHDDNPLCVGELPDLIEVARRKDLDLVRISDLQRA
jgi:peptidoglycan/xylan/chitin deacetylase (PgdA/CDA1 family)